MVLCGLAAGAWAEDAPRRGGVLRVGMQTDPVGLDPHTTNSTATRNLLENVYDTLVAMDPHGGIVPALAQAWSVSPDGLTWTFVLRSGIRFHNGQPLSAEDVVYSLMRIKDPRVAAPRAEDFAPLLSVRTEDARTVVLRLSRPYAPLLTKLAFTLNAIVSRQVARHGDLQHEVVGTGPFQLVEYTPQVHLVLARNPAHWGRDAQGRQLPYLDGIDYQFYPDAAARTLALRTGQVDFIEYVPAADVRLLQREPDLRVQGGVSGNYRSLLLNLRVPPLDKVAVRQALALAIDRRAVVDLALFGAGGMPAWGAAIPADHPGRQQDGPEARRDVVRARQLLREAGHPGGFALTLYVTGTYDFLRAPAEVIQANLKEIGVRVHIKVADWSLFLPDLLQRRFQAAVFGESGLVDPDDFLYESFHSGGSENLGDLRDAELDTLLEQGRESLDPAARMVLYDAAERRILQLMPQVFLFHSAQYEAYHCRVQGYQHYRNTSYLGLRRTWLLPDPGR